LATLCAIARANRGSNIAMTFALSLVPLISFVGAAIDDSRAAKSRTSMQDALD
jgi:Flp pilus assembly protein TadG